MLVDIFAPYFQGKDRAKHARWATKIGFESVAGVASVPVPDSVVVAAVACTTASDRGTVLPAWRTSIKGQHNVRADFAEGIRSAPGDICNKSPPTKMPTVFAVWRLPEGRFVDSPSSLMVEQNAELPHL